MILLFALSIIGTLIFGILLGIETNSETAKKRGLYFCLAIICYAIAVTIGILAIADGRYTKNIKCKSYEVKQIQEIEIIDADTISTSYYVLYNIER